MEVILVVLVAVCMCWVKLLTFSKKVRCLRDGEF